MPIHFQLNLNTNTELNNRNKNIGITKWKHYKEVFAFLCVKS